LREGRDVSHLLNINKHHFIFLLTRMVDEETLCNKIFTRRKTRIISMGWVLV
jgi:hypothetical protein